MEVHEIKDFTEKLREIINVHSGAGYVDCPINQTDSPARAQKWLGTQDLVRKGFGKLESLHGKLNAYVSDLAHDIIELDGRTETELYALVKQTKSVIEETNTYIEQLKAI